MVHAVKNLNHETLFDETIIRTVINVVQYEDDHPIKVDTAKLLHSVKTLKLSLRYVMQNVTASSVKHMRQYAAKCPASY